MGRYELHDGVIVSLLTFYSKHVGAPSKTSGMKSPFSLNIENFLEFHDYFNFTISTIRHSNRPLKAAAEFSVSGGHAMSDAQVYIPVEQLSELRHKIIKAKNRMDKTADRSGLSEKLIADYISPIVKIYQPIISSLASHNSNLIYRARKCIDNKLFNNV